MCGDSLLKLDLYKLGVKLISFLILAVAGDAQRFISKIVNKVIPCTMILALQSPSTLHLFYGVVIKTP